MLPFKKSKKLLIIILFVIPFIFNGCGDSEVNLIKVGAILPLTGDISEYGTGCKRGIDLAIDEINSTGLDVKWIVSYADSKGIVKEAVNSLKSLESKSIDYVVGPVTSSAAISLIPIINSDNILLFSPTASSPELSCSSDLFLRVWPSDNYEAEAIANYAIESLKHNRAYIFYVNNDYGIGLKSQFEKTFTNNGGIIAGSESYKANATSFRSIITQMKGVDGIDCIYMIGYHTELAFLTRQIKESKLETQLLASANYETPELVELLGELANGVIYATPSTQQEGNEQNDKFISTFQKKYDLNPDIFAKNSYDIVMLLHKAIKYGKANDPIDVAKYIKNLEFYEGVSGNMKFNNCGDVLKPISIKSVQNQLFVELDIVK